MSNLTAPQRPCMGLNETRLVSVSFVGKLDSGELLDTGVTPTVTELGTSDLTFSNQSVSTSALTINGVSVAANAAVQFKVTAAALGVKEIVVQATSDSTPAQVLRVKLKLEVADDA